MPFIIIPPLLPITCGRPNKEKAINQLETLARRGYFSIPVYDFNQEYDKNGNPIWNCECFIDEVEKSFCI